MAVGGFVILVLSETIIMCLSWCLLSFSSGTRESSASVASEATGKWQEVSSDLQNQFLSLEQQNKG